MDSSDEDSPQFSFCNDDGRAVVKSYPEQSQYTVYDKVFLKVRRGGTEAYEGPYLIESVPFPKKYTLSSENGKSIENKITVTEDQLRPASG